jgi:hypothetical protein
MAGAPPAIPLPVIIGALYRKASDLFHFAGMLLAAGQDQSDAILAQQEAYNCSNRAQALQAGSAYSSPSAATLAALATACDTLEQAIKTSADWATLIAAAAALRQSMPAGTV